MRHKTKAGWPPCIRGLMERNLHFWEFIPDDLSDPYNSDSINSRVTHDSTFN